MAGDRSTGVDVVVVGGGPAGSVAAAALAGAGLGVVLLERSCYESERFGEVLSPQAVPLLESLGVLAQFLEAGHVPSPGLVSFWGGLKSERPSLFSPYGDGWHLDRARFDRMLAHAAAASGATLHTGARLKRVVREASKTGWSIEFSTDDDRTHNLRARFLIDATGRAAKLARRLGGRQERIDRLTAFVAFGESPAGADPRMLVEAAPSGWWYSATLHAGRLVFAYLTDADLLPRARRRHAGVFGVALRSAPHTRERARGVTLSAPRLISAISARLITPAGPDWLALGDAAAAFDPLSGFGMVRAINSGLDTARVVAEHLRAAGRDDSQEFAVEYGRRCSSIWSAYLDERRRVYGSERRWPDSVFWQRRQTPPPSSDADITTAPSRQTS